MKEAMTTVPIAVESSHDTRFKKKKDARSSITVVVLGDEGVGKSSLISSFISRRFSPTVPGIMTRVRLPPDAREKCVTTIIDTQNGDSALMSSVVVGTSTSSSEVLPPSMVSLSDTTRGESSSSSEGGSRLGGGERFIPGMCSVLDSVDAIVLVYDLGREETFERLESHWLPLIEQCYGEEVPVIIAANKEDLITSPSPSAAQRSRQRTVSLLQRFKSVRQSMKCSAKTLVNVNDVILKAQHSVLYPIHPLYNLSEGKLSEDAVRAFTRIFRMFDKDRDGLLSHDELQAFQNRCFRVPLMEGDLVGWKKVLTKNNPEQKVIIDGKFTLHGILTMYDVFINSDRLEIPWIILRIFGYDDDLRLKLPENIMEGRSPYIWKLSNAAVEFLTETFQQFDLDRDGFLSANNLSQIFRILPNPSLPPWHPERISTIEKNSLLADVVTPILLSYLDWMSLWHMISTISNPSFVRSELYKLGFVEPSPRKQRVTARNKINITQCPRQTTIRIALSAPTEVSSSLMSHLCHNQNMPCTHIKYKHDENGEEIIFFVFKKLEDFNDARFDLVIFGFDSKYSWDHALEAERSLNDDRPRVFIGMGDDDDVIDKAVKHCAETDLEEPLTTKYDRFKVLEHVTKCAYGVKKAMPYAEKRKRDAQRKKILWFGGLVSVSVAVVVGVSMLLTRKGDRRGGGWLRSWFGRR